MLYSSANDLVRFEFMNDLKYANAPSLGSTFFVVVWAKPDFWSFAILSMPHCYESRDEPQLCANVCLLGWWPPTCGTRASLVAPAEA